MRLLDRVLTGRAFARLLELLQRLARHAAAQPVGLIAVALCGIVLASLPFSETDVTDVAKIVLPGLMVTGALAQLSTFAFLAVLYRRTSRLSAAVLAGVFVASGTVALLLPVIVPLGPSREPLMVVGVQFSAWVWIAWHLLFPAGALLYAAVRAREKRGAPVPGSARVIRIAMLAGLAAGLSTFEAVVWGSPFLPPLVHGLDLTGYRTSHRCSCSPRRSATCCAGAAARPSCATRSTARRGAPSGTPSACARCGRRTPRRRTTTRSCAPCSTARRTC
jgi:hypothetical protein